MSKDKYGNNSDYVKCVKKCNRKQKYLFHALKNRNLIPAGSEQKKFFYSQKSG